MEPEEQTTEEATTERSLIRIPETTGELRPPKAKSLHTETENYLRAYFDESHISEFLKIQGGTATPINGSAEADEWKLVFRIQDHAKLNGYALLGNAPANKVRASLRVAVKGITDTSIPELRAQAIRLRIEHKRS